MNKKMSKKFLVGFTVLLTASIAIAAPLIRNSNIDPNAAIAHSKMAALSTNKAMQTDGSGKASASGVTATELGYVSGVTSAIQTQFSGKEDVSNKSTSTSLGASNTLYPSQNAVKSYVDTGLATKQGAITTGTTSQYFKGDLSLGTFQTDARGAFSATPPLDITAGVVSIPAATGSSAGHLAAADFLTFANKSGSPSVNKISNPNFEVATTGWTASAGTFTRTTSAGEMPFGMTAAGKWIPNAANDTVSANTLTMDAGYSGDAELSCWVKSTAGALHKLQVFDGTNVVGSSNAIPALANFQLVSFNFLWPSSGTVTPRILAGDTNTIFWGKCYVGPATNVGNVSQSYLAASAYFPSTSGCTWTHAGNTTFQAYAAVGSCPALTTEVINAPFAIASSPSGAPEITLNNAPPGVYSVRASFVISSSAGTSIRMGVNDGTTTSGDFYSAGVQGITAYTLNATFKYTTAGSHTFAIWGAQPDGQTGTQPNLVNDNGTGNKLRFEIFYSPSGSQLAANVNTTPLYWSGTVPNSCSWTVSSTGSFQDPPSGSAGCVLTPGQNANISGVTQTTISGNPGPGIIFTSPKTGVVKACAYVEYKNSQSFANGYRLVDGSSNVYATVSSPSGGVVGVLPLCSQVPVNAGAATTLKIQILTNSSGTAGIGNNTDFSGPYAISWTIEDISQAMNAPVLVGSVTSNSSGAERIERARISNNGTCAVVSQSGSWITGISHPGTGSCTITITGFSATPSCSARANKTYYFMTQNNGFTPSATSMNFLLQDAGNSFASTDGDFEVICMGPK